MSSFAQKRCLRHQERQAVARCPECGLFYCRECITEHDEKILCAGCLRKKSEGKEKAHLRTALWHRMRGGIKLTLLLIIGALLCWSFFMGLGALLLKIPSSFHDGTILNR